MTNRTYVKKVKIKCKCGEPSDVKGLCRRCYNRERYWIVENRFKRPKNLPPGYCPHCTGQLKKTKINNHHPRCFKELYGCDIDRLKLLVIRWERGYVQPLDSLIMVHLYLKLEISKSTYDFYSIEVQVPKIIKHIKDFIRIYEEKTI